MCDKAVCVANFQLCYAQQPEKQYAVAKVGAGGTAKAIMDAREMRKMQNDENDLIQDMVKTIVREADPDTVILFGSRAQGVARPDSDVDLLIVEREPFSAQRSRRQETARLYLALRKLAVPKDLLLYSRDEFERLKDSAHHVVGRARREGKVLHERAGVLAEVEQLLATVVSAIA